MKPIVKFILVTLLSMGLAAGAGLAQAEPHDKLVPLLGNIDGWKAGKGTGSSLAGGVLKMIKAHRSYTQAKKKIDVELIINSGPPPASHMKDYKRVIGDKTLNTKKVDDYWVHTTLNKNMGVGQIFVALAHNNKAHAILLLTYTKTNEEEALGMAKKFKWKALKKATEKLL